MKWVELDVTRDKLYHAADKRIEGIVSQDIYLDVEDWAFDADGPDWAGHRIEQVYRFVMTGLRWMCGDSWGLLRNR